MDDVPQYLDVLEHSHSRVFNNLSRYCLFEQTTHQWKTAMHKSQFTKLDNYHSLCVLVYDYLTVYSYCHLHMIDIPHLNHVLMNSGVCLRMELH